MPMTGSRRLPIAAITTSLLVTALALGLVGCSASGTPSSSSSSSSSSGKSGGSAPAGSSGSSSVKNVGPCVLSAAEVSPIVKKTITKAEVQERECSYTGGGDAFAINVFAGDSGGSWSDQLAILKVTGDTPITISGVGDRAAAHGQVFDVQAKGYIVSVLGADEDGSTTYPTSVALAKAVIAKLP